MKYEDEYDDDDDGIGPFQMAYVFIAAMVLGCFMIAGLYVAFTIFAPVLWP